MKCRLFVSVFVTATLANLLGCATSEGLQRDMESFQQSAERLMKKMFVGHNQTPSGACEPIYQEEGASSSYRKCLTQQITEGLSEEQKYKLRFVKAFPPCVPLFRAHDISAESFDQYGRCQVTAFIRSERDRLVTWREDLRKRDRQESSRTSGHRSSKKVAGS